MIKALAMAGTALTAALFVAAPAGAQIVTSKASLVNGQLTIVGSGAVPNSNVNVDDSPTSGQADAHGDFSISASGFSEPSCVATLYDGSVSVEVTLSGCTPTSSPPPAVPGPPSPVGPPPGAPVTEPVALSWQPPAGTRGLHFQWQVSTDPNFGTLVLTATTAANVTSARLSGLADGTYYWRVQSVSFPPSPYFALFGNWTPTRSLKITGQAPGTPGTPTVTSPDGTEFHPEESFPLTWSAAQGAAGYRLQMASSRTFAPGTVLVDVPESTTTAHAPLIDQQTPLFVRVFGVAADGTLGLPSPTLALRLTFHAPVPPPPSLLTPAEGAKVTLPVALSWTADPNPQTAGYELVISSSPGFPGDCAGAVLCVTSLTPPRWVVHSLAAGTYFWRVRSSHGLAGPDTGAVTAWSAARSFTVSNAPPWVKSLTIDVFTEGGVVLRSHTHVFSGTNGDNEAFGIVQLSTPAPAGGATITLASSNPKAATVPSPITIPAGQAQGSFKISPLQVSSPATLTLGAALAGHAATAPLTVDPAALSQVFIGSNQSGPTSVASGGTPQVGTVLVNGNAPGGSVVKLASNSPAASVPATVTAAGQLVSFSIATKEVTASTPVVISASWRSKTVSVKMILQPRPVLLAPAAGASFATGHVVIFRWHTPAGLSSELQVATNPAFKNPVTDLNTNGAQAWAVSSLPSGKLYWRVRGVDVYGVQGPPSAVRTFTVRPPSGPLPAPVPEFPANGATVTAGQQVAFFWQPVNGAASYELQVANSAAFTPPLVLDQTVTGNQVNTSTLPAGTLSWRVRALDSQGPGAWSVTFTLTVQAGHARAAGSTRAAGSRAGHAARGGGATRSARRGRPGIR
jgi:hypothetical protein